MRTLISFIFLLCMSQTSFAGSPYEMSINVNVSDGLLKSHSTNEVEMAVRTKLTDAETCINQAFAAGQSRIRLKLRLSSLQWLKQEEVALLSQSTVQPDRSADGSLIMTPTGISTQNFTLNYYDVPVNHVPLAFTHASLRVMNQPDVASLLRSIDLGQEPKNVSEATIRKLNSFTLGNLIRIAQSELFHQEDGNWYVVPHELMHAIADFEDNYTDPSQTAPNLMGAYNGGNTCILNGKQIALFLKNRKLAAP